MNALIGDEDNELEAIQNEENQNGNGQLEDIVGDDQEEGDNDIEEIANKDKLEIGSRKIVINKDDENKFDSDKRNNNNNNNENDNSNKNNNKNRIKRQQIYNANQVKLRKSRGMLINVIRP